jgi:hypothetical protein
MQTITIRSGQSLFDIALQFTGDVINTYAIALANGKSITDALVTGETIEIPDGLVVATRELKYLRSFGILPATGVAIDQENILIPELGIGTMAIGTTFIIG